MKSPTMVYIYILLILTHTMHVCICTVYSNSIVVDVSVPGDWLPNWILQQEDALLHESIPFIDDELNK